MVRGKEPLGAGACRVGREVAGSGLRHRCPVSAGRPAGGFVLWNRCLGSSGGEQPETGFQCGLALASVMDLPFRDGVFNTLIASDGARTPARRPEGPLGMAARPRTRRPAHRHGSRAPAPLGTSRRALSSPETLPQIRTANEALGFRFPCAPAELYLTLTCIRSWQPSGLRYDG